ncbi:MAG: hypothetical protein ACXVCY_18520 [Pseudobdellovibrionaceae bacterium]
MGNLIGHLLFILAVFVIFSNSIYFYKRYINPVERGKGPSQVFLITWILLIASGSSYGSDMPIWQSKLISAAMLFEPLPYFIIYGLYRKIKKFFEV